MLSGDRVILRHEAMDKGQAERLLPLLEEVLAEGGLRWADLAALVVGTGPGNFTGVRIAVAAARGLALGLEIPAFGVTRLEALAHGLPRPVTVIEDARRGEVYVQEFGIDGPGVARISPDAAGISGPVTGTGAPAGLPAALPLVVAMGQIGRQRLGGTPQRPAPFYLRAADAAPPTDPPPVILP